MYKCRWLIVALLFATAANAQIKTITGGGYQYPNGTTCSGCVLYLQLIQDATVSGTGQVVPKSLNYTLDSNGNVPSGSNLWGNDQLQPQGTTYQASLYYPGGGRIWGPEYLSITGVSPINLSQLSPVSSSSVLLANAATTGGNNAFTGNNSFAGTSTFTGGISSSASNSWSAANTFTGNVVATAGQNQLSVLSLNGVQYCDKQTGATADVQINAAVANLLSVGGGTLDCRGYAATTQTISAPVEIGSNTTGKPIVALFDSATKFNCNFSSSSACLTIDGNSSYYATGVAANAGWVAAAGSSMSNVVLYRNNLASSFVGGFIWGIHAGGNATATVSDALFGVQNALQLTQIQNVIVGAAGQTATVMCKIYATSGNSVGNIDWINSQCDGGGLSGNRAMWIGCAASGSITPVSCTNVSNIIIDKGLLVHAGTGLAIATVEASNGASGVNPVGNVRFRGVQLESSFSNTVGILVDGAENVAVDGLQATSVIAGSVIVKLSQPAGTTLDGVKVDTIDNQGAWTTAISNTVASTTSNDRGLYLYRKNAATKSFQMDEANGTLLTVDSTGMTLGNPDNTELFNPPNYAFANLGTPSNGAIVYCHDCNIANPCTGSGSGAIAKRLNGVWVCN